MLGGLTGHGIFMIWTRTTRNHEKTHFLDRYSEVVGILGLLVRFLNYVFGRGYVLLSANICSIAVRGRQQIFLSGFVQDMAKVDAMLPDEVYIWMLDECSIPLFPMFLIAAAYELYSMFGNQRRSCICIF